MLFHLSPNTAYLYFYIAAFHPLHFYNNRYCKRRGRSVSVSGFLLGFKTKNMKSLNLLLVIAILCTLFVENVCSTFIRAWNVEPCCYRDSQSNDLIQIDPGTGIAETISEPVVSNCEE